MMQSSLIHISTHPIIDRSDSENSIVSEFSGTVYIWSSGSAITLLYLRPEVILCLRLNVELNKQDDFADVYNWILWVLKNEKTSHQRIYPRMAILQ